MALVLAFGSDFLVAGALAGVGYALGQRRKRAAEPEQLAEQVKALKRTTEDHVGSLQRELRAKADGQQVERLQGSVRQLQETAEADSSTAQIELVTERVQQLEGKFGVASAGIAQLTEQVHGLQERVDAGCGGSQAMASDPRAAQLEHLMGQVHGLQEQMDAEARRSRLQEDASGARLERLAAMGGELQQRLDAQASGIESQVGRLAERLGQLQRKVDAEGAGSQLGQLREEVDELKKVRSIHTEELHSSDGLVLDLQAKVGSLGVCIDTVNERIRKIELVTKRGSERRSALATPDGAPGDSWMTEPL